MNASAPRSQFATLPRPTRSRLTHARLRQPTPLPGNDGLRGYLSRLLWRFGAN